MQIISNDGDLRPAAAAELLNRRSRATYRQQATAKALEFDEDLLAGIDSDVANDDELYFAGERLTHFDADAASLVLDHHQVNGLIVQHSIAA